MKALNKHLKEKIYILENAIKEFWSFEATLIVAIQIMIGIYKAKQYLF